MSYEDLKEKFLNDDRSGSNLWRNERIIELLDAIVEAVDALEDRVEELED